ncbi:MAG: NUDIX hydrolase N-terminal domain-containing protein [Halobacteriaceae archaeon]
MDALALLDELRAMAQTGLNYADDPYDRARYERILELVETHYGETLDLPPAAVRERLADELGQVTPNGGQRRRLRRVGTGARNGAHRHRGMVSAGRPHRHR